MEIEDKDSEKEGYSLSDNETTSRDTLMTKKVTMPERKVVINDKDRNNFRKTVMLLLNSKRDTYRTEISIDR